MIARALQLSVQDFYDSFTHGNHVSNEPGRITALPGSSPQFPHDKQSPLREALHRLVRIMADETILS